MIYNIKINLSVSSRQLAKEIWGEDTATEAYVEIPIQFCPFCGEKLGGKRKCQKK